MAPPMTGPMTRTEKDAQAFFDEITKRAAGTLRLDDERLARLVSNRDALADAVVTEASRLSVTDQYKGEEVRSHYGYSVYLSHFQTRDIETQVSALAEIFEAPMEETLAHYERTLKGTPLAPGAEGRFVALKPSEDFCAASLRVMQAIAAQREITTHGTIYDSRCLRRHAHTGVMLARLAAQQPGPFVIFDAQLGRMHAGKSIRRVREILRGDEFGLDMVTFGCILLTHFGRFHSESDISAQLPGEEVDIDATGACLGQEAFESARMISHERGSVIQVGNAVINRPWFYAGSATGFLPYGTL